MKKRPPGIAMTPQKRNGPPSDATGSNGNDVLSTKDPLKRNGTKAKEAKEIPMHHYTNVPVTRDTPSRQRRNS